MSDTGRIAAVILAAGRSSRMGRSKLLLPVGPVPALARVIGSTLRAGVDDVVVVTGHRPEELAAVLAPLPVRQAHNPGYDAGMFSSVKTGVRALPDDVAAFFVLPADHPLIGARVFEHLVAAFRAGAGGIVHPTCCGRRGHPTLISGRHRDALLRADDGGHLRGFLQAQVATRAAADTGAAEGGAAEGGAAEGGAAEGGAEIPGEVEIEVQDLTILMDMDTEEDYRRVCRIAGFMDAAEARTDAATGAAGTDPGAVAETNAPEPALSFADAEHLLSLCAPPDRVRRHCYAVAAVGAALVEALQPHAPHLDGELVRAACLLHDMARAQPQHPAAARNVLDSIGLSRLGTVVAAHMVLPPEHVSSDLLTEEQLVYLADKLVVDHTPGTLAQRTDRMLREWGPGPIPPETLEGMRRRMQVAETVQSRVEALLGRPLDEVLPRATR